MKKLSTKYEERLNVLMEIKSEIKDRKSLKINPESIDKRMKATSAF